MISGCNLTLEVLTGCGYSCSDCSVDKTFAAINVPPADVEALLALIDSFPNEQYHKLELSIGPTDLISSDSGISALKEPVVVELARRYRFLVIPLSLLAEKGIVEMCQVIDEYLPTVELILNVPATIKNLKNPKYLSMIDSRLQLIKSNLHIAKFRRINFAVNLIKDNIETITMAEDRLLHKIRFNGVETAIEYGFGHSRKGFDNLLAASQMSRDLKLFSMMIHDQVDSRFNRMLVPKFRGDVEMVYRSGKLYQLPVIQERFPIFKETFEIQKPWNVDAALETMSAIYYDNLTTHENHPTCGDCTFMGNCAKGDIISLMKVLGSDECPIDMKNRYDLDPDWKLGEFE
jgi:hypothetical protein